MPRSRTALPKPDEPRVRTKRGPTRSYRPFQRASDGLWLIAVSVPGSKKRPSVSGKTAAQARKRLPGLLRDIADGKYGRAAAKAPVAITVKGLLSQWIVAKGLTVEPNTLDGYRLQSRHLEPLHAIPVDELTRPQVRELVASQRLTHSAAATNAMLNALKMAIRWGSSEDPPLANNMTVLLVEPVKSTRSPAVPLHPDDVRKILSLTWPRQRVDEATVLLGTGARVGELLGLRRQDWDGGKLTIAQQVRRVPTSARAAGGPTRQVSHTKTKAGLRRIVPAPFAAEVLDCRAAAAPRRDSLLFPTGAGGPQHGRTVNRNFHRIQTRAGCEQNLGPHSARHTVAAQLIAAAAGLDDVKRYLGHSQIAHTSDLYGHWIDSRMEELAVALGHRLMPEWEPIRDRIADGIAEEVVSPVGQDLD